MKPHRLRQICRSHNRFSPSIALWQHFVLPCRPLRQQRLLSSATEPTALATDANSEGGLLQSSFLPDQNTQPDDVSLPPDGGGLEVRRVVAHRGKYLLSAKDAAIRKNLDTSASSSKAHINLVLQRARLAFNRSQDYQGVVVQAITSKSPVTEASLPWAVRKPLGSEMPAHERLTLEIARFDEYARPSRTEALARRHLIEQVRTDVRQTLPDHVLEVFGSERTGIALAGSDIDLRLVGRETFAKDSDKIVPDVTERKELIVDLKKLRRKALARNDAYLLPTIRYARYPLVSFQDRASGLDVQIVSSNDTTVSRELMQRYMQEIPYLRQLYSVVKTTFDVRGLSDVYRGGIGSYPLFMMLVVALKLHPPERPTAGGALLTFFRYWARFDTTAQGITIEPLAVFDKSEKVILPEKVKSKILEGDQKPLPPYMLTLRDPADETNDLGRKGMCIKHFQATCQQIENKIIGDLKKDTRYSLLYPLVGDVYSLSKERRDRLEQQGRRVLRNMYDSFADTAKAIREEEIAEQALPAAKPSEPASDDFGEAVTSILGMPGREEWSKGSGVEADAEADAEGTQMKEKSIEDQDADGTGIRLEKVLRFNYPGARKKILYVRN